jgi:hypothetical protein
MNALTDHTRLSLASNYKDFSYDSNASNDKERELHWRAKKHFLDQAGEPSRTRPEPPYKVHL